MKASALIIALILAAAVATPAFGRLRPASSPVDFGVITEKEGEKTVRFYVVNDGDSPESIRKVRPTCGCTGADFERKEIAPGDSAWVDLTYNPYRRPGRFNKAVKIYPATRDGEAQGDESDSGMISVPITGVVLASDETLAVMFPVEAGSLSVSERILTPARPLTGEDKTLFLDVYNRSDRPLKPVLRSDTPAVETQSFPEELPPGEKGLIGVYLLPRKETRKGDIEYRLLLEGANGDGSGITPTEIKVLVNNQ